MGSRDVILRELRKGSASDPSLAEILGVRLLVNLLRPLAAGQRLTPEALDRLLNEISHAKHQLARKFVREGNRRGQCPAKIGLSSAQVCPFGTLRRSPPGVHTSLSRKRTSRLEAGPL